MSGVLKTADFFLFDYLTLVAQALSQMISKEMLGCDAFMAWRIRVCIWQWPSDLY